MESKITELFSKRDGKNRQDFKHKNKSKIESQRLDKKSQK
jgi:hypothetical protein